MSNILCFMDFEFTTSGDQRKDSKEDCVELLSMAGIFVDTVTNEMKDVFHEIVKPTKNKKLSDFCISLTNISQKDVDSAREMKLVVEDFLEMTSKYNNAKYIVWGGFDTVALRKTIRICDYQGDFKQFIYRLKDIQPQISNSIRYNGVVVNSNWGLQKVRSIYNLEESSSHHNALSDAKDLWEVYMAYTNKQKRNMYLVKESYDKLMAERALIARRRQTKHENDIKEIFSTVGDAGVLYKQGLNKSSIKTLLLNTPVEVRGCDYIGIHKNTISIKSGNEVRKNSLSVGKIIKGDQIEGSVKYRYTDLCIEVKSIYIVREPFNKPLSAVEVILYDKNKVKAANIIVPINNQTKKNIIMFIETNFGVNKND